MNFRDGNTAVLELPPRAVTFPWPVNVFTGGEFSECEKLFWLFLCGGTPLYINLLKPTGHVMHQQFNIQQLYALPTQYLCVLYLSENKQRLVPLTA